MSLSIIQKLDLEGTNFSPDFSKIILSKDQKQLMIITGYEERIFLAPDVSQVQSEVQKFI